MTEQEAKKLSKRIREIKKKNKMYFRDKHGTLLRLDKFSGEIYGQLIVEFARGAGKKFKEMNQFAKSQKEVIPIVITLPRKEFKKDWDKLAYSVGNWDLNEPITILGNSSALKIIKVQLEKEVVSDTVKGS